MRWYLIPVAELGFGHDDQPSGSLCANATPRLGEMKQRGSFQRVNEVGGRAKTPAANLLT